MTSLTTKITFFRGNQPRPLLPIGRTLGLGLDGLLYDLSLDIGDWQQ